MLFPPLNKRNTYDKAKGLYITSERHLGKLSARYLSTRNRGQDSRQQSPYRFAPSPPKDAPTPSYPRAEDIAYLCSGRYTRMRLLYTNEW